jgi:hypothetical protein
MTFVDIVEQLFNKCLLQCLDVDLWTVYLKYVKMAWEGQESYNQELSKLSLYTR